MSKTLFSYNEIKEIIPAKEPLLLLDKVQIINDTKAIGVKALTANEVFFTGHFPGHPIFPGVLAVEGMAQLAEMLLWQKLDPQRIGDIYVKRMEDVKFRKPNNPGDRIFFEVNVTEMGSDYAKLTATATNNSGLASQAKMTLAVRPRETEIAPIMPFNEVDKSENTHMDVPAIEAIIPHRFPFMFVDYVSKIDLPHIRAVKNVTGSEPLFRTYKDGYSVLMGSVQPEIIAQAGCIFMLSNESMKGKIAYFMGMGYTDIFGAVRPGDQMRLETDMPDPSKRFGKGEGELWVGDKLISRSTMTFAIIDPEKE